MVSMTGFWPSLALSSHEQRTWEVRIGSTRLNALGVSPPLCPQEGGHQAQHTLEPMLVINLLLPCEKTIMNLVY